jgi:hypothetical protein
LHDGEHGCFRSRLAFPSPAETGAIGIIAWVAADVEFINLDGAIERLFAGQYLPQNLPMRQAVGWLTPIASARRTAEMPLSDCRMSKRPDSLTRRGSLEECNGVRVVTVNYNRHSRLGH